MFYYAGDEMVVGTATEKRRSELIFLAGCFNFFKKRGFREGKGKRR